MSDVENLEETFSELANGYEELRQRLEERELSKSNRVDRYLGLPPHHRARFSVPRAGPSSSSRQGRGRPESWPGSISECNIVGIEQDVKKLVHQLIHPQCDKHFAIVGMGGSGKTTLARKIYNHKEINAKFKFRAWICVSQDRSEESLMKDMFSQTTRQNSINLTKVEMVQKMCEVVGKESCLVVIDDVWKQDALRILMVPIIGSIASKFIITTRNKKVIQSVNLPFFVLQPRKLTHNQSLELFTRIAYGHQSNTPMPPTNHLFVKQAEKMLKTCDGLPLAVISLAGLLRDMKIIQEWMEVGDNVSSAIIENDVDLIEYGKAKDVLGLSYSDLDQILKSCFMYLSLFQENVEIPCGMLMRCWIVEGFFQKVQLPVEKDTVEVVARKYLNELIQRCLVQIARVNYVEAAQTIRVHGLLRYIALREARAKYFSDTFPSSSPPKSSMLFLRSGINPNDNRDLEKLLGGLGLHLNGGVTPTRNQDKVSRRLRTLVLFFPHFGGNIYWSTLFTNYRLLRVLIIDGFDEKLPNDIGELIHLRYLRLSFDHIACLPRSIEKLRNLVSFDYRTKSNQRSESWNMPNLEQLKKLRYLRLPCNIMDDKTTRECDQALNLHELQSLRVLWGIPSGKWMTTQLKYLTPTVKKLGITGIGNSEKLQQVYQCPSIVENNLDALMLSWRSDAKFELRNLHHCTKLRKLYLGGVFVAPFAFPPHLSKLELAYSKLGDKDSFANVIQSLTHLKVLKLAYYAYVGVDLTFPANSLLALETLQLFDLPDVERIHTMEGAMPHLKSFDIDQCNKLEAIPQKLKHLATTRIVDARKKRSEDKLKGSDGDEANKYEDYMFVSDEDDKRPWKMVKFAKHVWHRYCY